MKINLKKYQSGGPFVTIRPLFDTPIQSPVVTNQPYETKNSSEKTKSSLVDDDIDDLLKKSGLTNDHYALLDQLNKIENNPYAFLDPSNSSKAVNLIRGKINEAINNKEIWQGLVTQTKESGAYAEVAVGSSGELFYKDENNNISTVSMKKVLENTDKYNLLSVRDLLNERQINPNLAFDQNIFNITGNAVSSKHIIDKVMDLFDTLSQYSEKSERTYSKEDLKKKYNLELELIAKSGKKPTEEERSAISSIFEKLNTPGEFVKEEVEQSRKGKDLNLAINYIWKSLNQNEKLKLQAIAVTNNEKDPLNILKGMIYNYGAESVSSKISPVKESDIVGKSGNSGTEKSLQPLQLAWNDELFSPNLTFALNDPKLGSLFKGVISGVSPIITETGQVVENATLNDIFTKANYANFLDTSKVFFGDKKVSTYDYNNIIYDDAEPAAKVYMPVTNTGAPDFDSLKEFNELYAVYEINKKVWSKETAMRHFSNEGFNLIIDEVNGEKIIRDNNQVKPFLLLYGFTNDAVNITKDNKWITELSKNEERVIKPKLEAIWSIGSGKNFVNLTPNKKLNYEDYYKGLIAVPFREGSHAIINSMSDRGPTKPVATIGDVQRNLWYSSNQPNNGSLSAWGLINK